MSQSGPTSSSGSGSAGIETLEGNSGGKVSADFSFNVDVVGNNSTGINVVGTPASSLLTIIGESSSTTQIGTIGIATDAEVIAGTNTDEAVVPSSLSAKLGSQIDNALAIGNTTSGALNWTSAGTDGQVCLGATGADPEFSSLTSSGSTISYTTGTNSLNLETGSAVATSFPTDSGTAIPSSGALTMTGISGITVTGSGSTVTIAATGTPWNEITGTSSGMLVNEGYISSNAGLVTLTLPATASIGDTIQVAGKGAGGWLVAQNAGQTIHFGSSDTTTGAGGTLASTNRYDGITLLCVTANTDFVARSSFGNITVV